MKYSIKVDVHPLVAVLLILLALIGLDLAWTQQRKAKRASAPIRPQPGAAPPVREPNAPTGKYTVERDAPPAVPPSSPFGPRRPRPSVEERIGSMNAAVKEAAVKGANAYVERQQQPT